MNVVEIINEAIASGRTRFAFELLPPLKGDGMQKIFAAVEPLMDFDPSTSPSTARESRRPSARTAASNGTSCAAAPGRWASRRPSRTATAWRWSRT